MNESYVFYPTPPRSLTTTVTTSPAGLRVSDSVGTLARLTVGSKTVTVRGPVRTFTEQKRPFVDSFERVRTGVGWGQSPGGGNYSQSGAIEQYDTDGSSGRIHLATTNSSRHTTLLDDLTDVNATAVVSVSAQPAGAAASVGLSIGYTSTSDANRARLIFTSTGAVQLVLEKEVAGTVTALGAATEVGTGFVAGDRWRIRAQRSGTTLRCRAWKDGTAEPATWLHSVTDPANPTGRVGIRGLASTGNTAIPFDVVVDEIAVESGKWPSPPTVTHNTWVHILNAPFNGTWTESLANRIRAWAVDSTPDALAYAMMYVTGAVSVYDPALSGKRIFGEAQYGPLTADGGRYEASDWNDFIGINWTYASGETRTFPHGNIQVTGAMDCSGFVRQVYGRHMGVPLTYHENFDGLNIPRATKDMGPSGPGIIIQQATGAAPTLTGIAPGDVPFFDADSSDVETGQIDHNGIYLGVDSAGNHRFVNSRKTPNGPTMADLGGTSLLNGAGLYARSLRIIRRF
ncbi:NlpC/P60 family protein [Streptomyces sp. NPDC127061]|uniref:NlpC/P60 family protein n=1 Tax=Streptomyces sp. NPDC127061 TaxID=3347122 RepID=UPI00365BF79E